MAGLHSSDFIKFVQYGWITLALYKVCSGFYLSLYNMAGLHSSDFIKFVQYGWITQ